MPYTITIHTDGAAFDPDPGPELARILRKLADGLDRGGALALFHATEEQSRALSAWLARPALVDELRAAAADY